MFADQYRTAVIDGGGNFNFYFLAGMANDFFDRRDVENVFPVNFKKELRIEFVDDILDGVTVQITVAV